MRIRGNLNRRGFLKNAAGIFVPTLILARKVIAQDIGGSASPGISESGNFNQWAPTGTSYTLQEDLTVASPGDENTFGDTAANTWLATSWTPAKSYNLIRVDYALAKTGSPTGNIKLRIYSNNATGPVPNAQQGSDSTTVAASSVATYVNFNTYNLYTFIFPANISITNGTKMWVAANSSVIDASNYLHEFDTGTAPLYDIANSTNGSTWTNICAACVRVMIQTYSSP